MRHGSPRFLLTRQSADYSGNYSAPGRGICRETVNGPTIKDPSPPTYELLSEALAGNKIALEDLELSRFIGRMEQLNQQRHSFAGWSKTDGVF